MTRDEALKQIGNVIINYNDNIENPDNDWMDASVYFHTQGKPVKWYMPEEVVNNCIVWESTN